MKKFQLAAMTALFLLCALVTYAQCNGASSNHKSTKTSYHHNAQDIVDIAIGSDVHTTLVAAVKAADLVSTLKSDGPFTVFAPTNAAFAKLPEGTVETLLKPANQSALASVLTYHVIAGKFTANDVIKAINLGGGKAKLTTVQGGVLTATLQGNTVLLTDENGGVAAITTTDLQASNGVIHVLDSVVLPAAK